MTRVCRGLIVMLTALSLPVWNLAQAQVISAKAASPSVQIPLAELRAKAEAGDAAAQHQLALAYHEGRIVPKDDTQTFAWNLKSAQQGYLQAELNIAWLYENGVGTTKDEAASFQWFLKGAKQGYAPAQCIVGDHYYSGWGVEKNLTEAFNWYKKAADQDEIKGEQLVAYFYLYGDPPFRDVKKGLTYALAAAGQNHLAAYYVADCYWRGVFVKPDKAYAYAFALFSNGLRPTRENSKQLSDYQNDMTPAEIARARVILGWLQARAKGVSQGSALSFDMGGRSSLKIPFRRVLNTLIVPVRVGHEPPVNFVIDTGSSSTCLDSRYAAQLGLEANDYKSGFFLGVEPSLIGISDERSLALGGLVWKGLRFYLTSLSLDRDLGQPIAGIIGSDILNPLVVRIDYEHSIIELIDPKTFHPTATMGEALPLQIKFEEPLPYVPASIVNAGVESKKETFLIDTGNSGSLDIEPGFWTDNPGVSFVPKRVGGASGFDGVVVRAGKGVCDAALLGSTRLERVVVDSNGSPTGGNINPHGGAIGNEVWRRFTVTLDYPGKRLFLEKNSHFTDPWGYPKAGMHVIASGPDYKTFTIAQILPNSAGALAGFQPGDVILKIDNLDPPTRAQIQDAFWTAGNYHVLVQRQDQRVTLDLHCVDDLK